MAHFAELDENNLVIQVVVINDENIWTVNGAEDESIGIAFLTNLFGHSRWKQTSFNKRIRKNFAGVGFTYRSDLDAFIAPSPWPSWVFNENTCEWESPIGAKPQDGNRYVWDETITSWSMLPNVTFDTPVSSVANPTL